MTDQDRKIRKRWLILLFTSCFVSVVNAALSIRYAQLPEDIVAIVYGMTACSVAAGFGYAYLIYYCAYKKHGTKLLTFSFVFTVITLLYTLIAYVSGRLPPSVDFRFHLVYLLISQLLGLCWAVLCWQMRKVNKKLQKLPAMPS